jgi:hypothetical protein
MACSVEDGYSEVRRGPVARCRERSGRARLALFRERLGKVRQGPVMCGEARWGGAGRGMVRLGLHGVGEERRGKTAMISLFSMVWKASGRFGMARHGSVRAGRGEQGHGLVRGGTFGTG